jgi:3-phosphoshikimate 1-carboxyvinyltransferase
VTSRARLSEVIAGQSPLPGELALDVPEPAGASPTAARETAAREVVIRPPGSKSLSNRAVLLAALASGASRISGALVDADDARVMLAALRTLGAEVTESGTELSIRGVGGRWTPREPAPVLNLHNAGTATRFLAAASLLAPGPVTIDGNARMRQRPIGELTGLLGALGVQAEFLGTPGFPPVRLTPGEARQRGTIEIPTTQSSQFISALLLVAPWLEGGLSIRLVGEVTSAPYVRMTTGQMRRLGARIDESADGREIRVEPGPLAGFLTTIEPDASGATCPLAAAAVVPGLSVRVPGLGADSLQGDTGFADLLGRMGAKVERGPDFVRVTGTGELRGIEADLSDMPDAALALAAACAMARGRSMLTGLRTLRVKETDRIEALRTELSRVGVRCPALAHDPDSLVIEPPDSLGTGQVVFQTYDDHRMAMSMALIALRRPGVVIHDPACVAKTYAGYWRDFAAMAGLRGA